MLQQSRDTKDLKPSHAKLSWSLSIGLGKRHEDKTLFAGAGVFHELKLPMPHQLFLAMCRVVLEAVPFAVRIGFLSSIGGGIAATLCADPVSDTQRKRTKRENPRRVPAQKSGKSRKKPGKSQKGQERTKKEGQVQIGKPPRDTNWWCIYYFLPRGHTSQKYQGSRVDLTFLR